MQLMIAAKRQVSEIDAVIDQFVDKGVQPVLCAIDFLGKTDRSEDTTVLTDLVASTFSDRITSGMSTTSPSTTTTPSPPPSGGTTTMTGPSGG
jgi:hypothetical protein